METHEDILFERYPSYRFIPLEGYIGIYRPFFYVQMFF